MKSLNANNNPHASHNFFNISPNLSLPRAFSRLRHFRDSPGSSKTSLSSTWSSDRKTPSKKRLRKEEKRQSQESRHRSSENSRNELALRRRRSSCIAAETESPDVRARYGVLAPNIYTEWHNENWRDLSIMSARNEGETIIFRARIHHLRKLGSKMLFLVFRQQLITMQGVLSEEADVISAHMVRSASRLALEDIVTVRGIVQKPQAPITGASIADVEVKVVEIHLVSKISGNLPFKVHEADAVYARTSEEIENSTTPNDLSPHKIPDRVRLANRVLDLRTSAAQAAFRIQSGVGHAFRTFLDAQGFIEIHTPKLQGGATESGASVFEVNYFGRPAFLAQSPQLAKQMAISSDFGRVYEIGPVFRAENSNTHRHMTEFIGLDIEMAINEHYHEAMGMIDGALKNIFKTIYTQYRREVEAIKHYFPSEDLVWLDETPVIPFPEGIKMLVDSGFVEEDGQPPKYEDLSSAAERRLGALMKKKYHTDFYILDKFPASARPFYTMPDPKDELASNSFDIFIRGQEVVSGAQRIHDPDMLQKNMKMKGVKVGSGMEEYIRGFDWAAPPHAGGGIGLERVVFLMLNLGDIRYASMFPRDPKSFPMKPIVVELPHQEADTTKFKITDASLQNPTDESMYPSLGKMIANYGDASNTSWLDDRYKVWRHSDTAAAVGWVPVHGHAIIIGNPLCDRLQYHDVIAAFLKYLKTQNLKPLWLLVGAVVEEILAEQLGWSSFSCIAESRVTDIAHNPANDNPDVARKVRHAKKEGVKIIATPPNENIPASVKEKIEVRMKDWKANRKGQQMHLTQLNPWRDSEHRRYFYAEDANGTVVAMVVMAQLSPEHGWQVKYALDFPNAPSGVIEAITLYAMSAIAETGAKNITFGASAVPNFTPAHNLKGAGVKMLSRTYHVMASSFHLMEKGEFRSKLGATEDPLFICYPRHSLGAGAIKAIVSFFQEE